MKASIIIPVYNVEQYLRQCVDSLLNQEGEDYEIILVDDGSKDASGTICDEYAAKYDCVSTYHTLNLGASHARNVGIEHAQGEWISFVDSDDWVPEDYLSAIPDTGGEDIIFFAYIQTFDNGDSICRRPHPCHHTDRVSIEETMYDLKYKYLGDIFGWTWNKFMKLSIIDKYHVRFAENIVVREDDIFTMDYCRHINSVRVLDTPLYYHRIRKGSLDDIGFVDSDFLNLAENMERNLPYFSNEKFLRREKKILADCHVIAFTRKARLRNMWSTMDEAHSFFKRKPEFREYASNQWIVRLLNHSKPLSYLLLMLWYGLRNMKARL